MKAAVIITLSVLAMAVAQRPGYAGRRPYGYPEMEVDIPAAVPQAGDIGDRFAVDDAPLSVAARTQPAPPTTTQRLPLEANGDANLVQRLSQLPIDRQPFWLINWQALEQQRNSPSSYEHRYSNFVRGLFK